MKEKRSLCIVFAVVLGIVLGIVLALVAGILGINCTAGILEGPICNFGIY